MVDRIRFTFDSAIQDLMSTEDIVKLSESIHSFIEYGIIDVDENDEIYIDQEYLIDLVGGIEQVRKGNKKYGRDDEGLTIYPFWGK